MRALAQQQHLNSVSALNSEAELRSGHRHVRTGQQEIIAPK
jgi:hypothetical protein